jgi:outer membrane protein TolC
MAFELALSADLGVKAAESDVAKADEGRRQAYRAQGITIKVEHNSANVKYQNESDVTVNSFQNVISATYPLYRGGLIEGSITAAEHELNSKILSLQRVKLDLKLSVTTAFFTMLRTEDMAKLAADAVSRLEGHVRNVDVQYRNGKVSKADLLRSEVELINARRDRSQAENDYRVAVKNLNDLMGLPLETELSYSGKMSYTAFAYTLEECVNHALAHHQDLAIAQQAELKAKAGIKVAESEREPSVSLSMSQTLNSIHNWPGLDSDNLQLVLHGEYTFSDAGVAKSKIRSAKEDLKKAGYNYQAVRDSIVLAVTTRFMEMNEAASSIETGVAALDKAQEAYRISLVRYREGVGTNIDVLDAQTSLNQTNSNYTQALCDYNIALGRLDNVLGVPISGEGK